MYGVLVSGWTHLSLRDNMRSQTWYLCYFMIILELKYIPYASNLLIANVVLEFNKDDVNKDTHDLGIGVNILLAQTLKINSRYEVKW